MIKLHFPGQGRKQNSGIILLVVLWLTVILSMLAIGLGRRASVDIALTQFAVDKTKAEAISWAGLMYAINQISRDKMDEETSSFDGLYQCAVKLDNGKTPEDVFKNISVDEGHFDINYLSASQEGTRQTRFGFADEERKINLNGINQQNIEALVQLIVLLGFDEPIAQTIAASVVDWYDADSEVTSAPFGAEDSDYLNLSQPYHCKDSSFENVEELLLVKGMTPEIFLKIKNEVTVFPVDASRLSVNFNTASALVIQALVRSVAGGLTNTELSDADSLTKKLISYRSGSDREEFTSDDKLVSDINQSDLNQKEWVIFQNLENNVMTDVSQYVRIGISGFEKASSAKTRIEAVVDRSQASNYIVSWHKN